MQLLQSEAYEININIDGACLTLAWPEKVLGDTDSIKDWIWLNQQFTKYSKGKRTIVTAGGACGLYPLAWEKHFEEVCTCEPDEWNYKFLAKNAEGHERIHHQWAAFGHKRGFCEINRNLLPHFPPNHFINNMGSTRVVDPEDGSVVMVTVDEMELLDVDVIQLDVEGFELPVIRGAIKTIEKYSPVISVETCVPGLRKLLLSLDYFEIARNVDGNGDRVFIRQ